MAAGTDYPTAALIGPPDDDAPDAPLRISRVTGEDTLTIGGSAAGALALDWVLYERVLPFTGVIGFWICWYILFVLCFTSVAALQWDRLAVRDRVVSVILTTGGLLAVAIVVDQVGYTLIRGFSVVKRLSFFTQSMSQTGPLSTVASAGVAHALIGTFEQITIATLLSVPLGVAAALYLAEV